MFDSRKAHGSHHIFSPPTLPTVPLKERLVCAKDTSIFAVLPPPADSELGNCVDADFMVPKMEIIRKFLS